MYITGVDEHFKAHLGVTEEVKDAWENPRSVSQFNGF